MGRVMNDRELTIFTLLTIRLERLQQTAWRLYQTPGKQEALARDLAHSCILIHRLAMATREAYDGGKLIGWMSFSQADNSKLFEPTNSFERDIPPFILTSVLPNLRSCLYHDRGAALAVLTAMHNVALNYIRELWFVPSVIITPTIERDCLECLDIIKSLV